MSLTRSHGGVLPAVLRVSAEPSSSVSAEAFTELALLKRSRDLLLAVVESKPARRPRATDVGRCARDTSNRLRSACSNAANVGAPLEDDKLCPPCERIELGF